jgi:hypothetical protein
VGIGRESVWARLNRIERQRGVAAPAHGWGQSDEEIRQMWAEMPEKVAYRAREIHAERKAGTFEAPTNLNKITGIELQALIVERVCEVGEDNVPTEWIEFEQHKHDRLGGELNEDMQLAAAALSMKTYDLSIALYRELGKVEAS